MRGRTRRDIGVVDGQLANAMSRCKTDRVGAHRSTRPRRHCRDDGRRVESRAEEGAEGHVAHQLTLDRRREPVAKLPDEVPLVGRVPGVGLWKREVPIPMQGQFPSTPDGIMRGRQFHHALEHRQRIGRPEEAEVERQRLLVQARLEPRHLEDGLGFGGEGEHAVADRIIKRLDTEVIARQHHLVAVAIPDGKRKHAVEACERVDAEFLA